MFLCITNYSNEHQSFVYTQLNDQTVLLEIIQFSMSHLFVLSLNIKQFYLTHRYDPIKWYHSGLEWTWEQWQWTGTWHSPKLQHYWNLTIRLFRVISGHSLEWESYSSAEVQLVYSTAPTEWAIDMCRCRTYQKEAIRTASGTPSNVSWSLHRGKLYIYIYIYICIYIYVYIYT